MSSNWTMANGVTMWDVGVERTVEVTGPDADRLIDYLTCRDLTKCAVIARSVTGA